MNTNSRISHQALTATQVLKSTGVPNMQARKASILTRIGRCLIAPAVVAVLMLGAHWSVFGSQPEAGPQAMEQEVEADSYFPAEYAFRAADFDDPFNFR